MQEKYITARECLNHFEEMGIKLTESNFSKYKKRGVFKRYKAEGKKSDLFIWREVIESYFLAKTDYTKEEEEIRKRYYRQKERDKKIEEKLKEIYHYEDLELSMFNIDNLYIEAQNNLKELQEKESRGEKISDQIKEFIETEAAKTKEDHVREFEKEILIANEIYDSAVDLTEWLRKGLAEKYPYFKGSMLEYDMLRLVATWIELFELTPKEFAEGWCVELIRK